MPVTPRPFLPPRLSERAASVLAELDKAMTDARALAHKIANDIGLCGDRYQKMYDRHSPVCDRIKSALAAARNEALEEAAVRLKLAATDGHEAARMVRALKDRP